MIRSIRCDQPQFHNVEFTAGFNVILAERTKESTKKDSRNGLGKTMLLEIIHFCLGAKVLKGSALTADLIRGWTFHLDIELGNKSYTFSRNTQFPARILVQGDYEDWPLKPSIDRKNNQEYWTIQKFNQVLGWLLFGLSPDTQQEKYAPSFRSLISYFIRKGRDAYSTPFEHHRKQLIWDMQIHNAFLLDLGWRYAQRLQILKDRGKAIDTLKKSASPELMSDLVGSIGELESVRIRLEEQILREREQLDSFQVHPQYKELEARATELTIQIHRLTNENVHSRRMLDLYENSYLNEKPADSNNITELYNELGIIFSNNVVNHLDAAREFYQRITENRRSFLEGEIRQIRDDLAQREFMIRRYSDERSSLLAILQSHGALDEYTQLQQKHLVLVSELESTTLRIENLRKFEQEKSSIRIEKEQVLLEARADYEERKQARQRAISLFNANSQALYEVPGKLIVNIDNTGYKFDVDIERSGSAGFEQMKVFCYDLMLIQLWVTARSGIDFLIHDSTIYADVDERQYAHALQLGAQKAETTGFQYITCLNSDTLPRNEFELDFDIDQYVRLVLTDDREDGGLLGIRF